MTAIYDPFAPDVLVNPAISYHHLLEEEPVYWCQDVDPDFYILSRYQDVESALQDIETFSSEFGQGPKYSMPAGMLSDPPQHTFFRRLVQKAFTPQSVELIAPQIESLASNLLEEIDDPTSWDLHDEYAFPLPVIVIANILGVPEQDLHLIKKWSDASVEAMGAEDPTSYQETLQKMAQYLLKQISERRLNSEKEPTDLISKLVAAKVENKGLTDQEILAAYHLIAEDGSGISSEKNLPVRWSSTDGVRWKIPLPEACNSTPIVLGERVFLTQGLDGGKRRALIALDRKTGKKLWQEEK